jgi:hypothetical protein
VGGHEMKKEIVEIRKTIWPMREVINNLENEESFLIKKSN